MPKASNTSSRTGRRAFWHSLTTRPGVSSPDRVVRSMQVIALSSHAACHSRLTLRRVLRVLARRSAAERLNLDGFDPLEFQRRPKIARRLVRSSYV